MNYLHPSNGLPRPFSHQQGNPSQVTGPSFNPERAPQAIQPLRDACRKPQRLPFQSRTGSPGHSAY